MPRGLRHIILFLTLLISGVMSYVQAAIHQGTCGAPGNEDNVTWKVDTEYQSLVINGTGPMQDYSPASPAPWASFNSYYDRVGFNTDVTNVGEYAFYNCQNITYVFINSAILSIGRNAFDGCTALRYVNIPSSITSIGEEAFQNCDALQAIYASWTTAGDLPTWTNMTNKNHSTLKLYIPCETASIYEAASGWNNYANMFETPVVDRKTCGPNATYVLSCDSVLTISGTGSMYNSAYVGDILSIKHVIIEDGITSIGNYIFTYCTNLVSVSIPSSVTSIGYSAFRGCPALTSVTIPSSVTSIGQYAFRDCNNLTDIYVSWTETAKIPTWNNLTNKTPQSDITLHVPCGSADIYEAKANWTDYTIDGGPGGTCGASGDNLTWMLCDSVLTISGIGAMADFVADADCPWYPYRSQIYTINIGDGVTTIGSKAFVFSRISSITIPNSVTSIGRYAFCYSNYLEEIVLPEGLISIGDHAFYYGNVLKTVHIPSSVTSLGVSAFEGCSLLQDLYVSWSSSIPEWPSKFSKTYGVTLHVPCGKEALYQAATGWKSYTTIVGSGDLASGTCGASGDNLTWTLSCDSTLTISGTGAMADYDDHGPWMYYWNQLKAIVIEPGVTAIGNHAFYQCFNVKDITIPSTVTHIGNEAFYMCSISEVIIPNSVETIGHGAFQSCGNLRDIYVSWETAVPVWDDMSITNGVTLHMSCATRILYDTTTGWQNYRILGDESFQITLQSADITMGQVKLGTGVAQDTVIATVHCGDSIITAIPSSACSLFQQWSDGITANPRTVSILSDTTLTAFFEPNIISGNCGTAGHEAEVTWSLNTCDSVLTISGTGAMADYDDHGPWMYYWNQLKTIVIEPGVTAIGNHAFYQCFNVKVITIPNTVTHIGNEAFYMCSISEVIIPNSVETIGHGAFQSCGNLRDIYVSWETAVPVWDDMSITNGVTLHMSCPTMVMYEAAAGWQNYTLEGDGVVTITVQTATGDTSLGSVSITVN